MRYEEKIKHAELVATELQNNVGKDSIIENLQSKNLYQNDIDKIMISAQNIIGENLRPLINTKLLAKEQVHTAIEFEKIDPEFLNRLIILEIKSIAIKEKNKVKAMLKNGTSEEEIFNSIDQDFYAKENISHQIAISKEVNTRNSSSTRLLYIFGGIAMMLIGAGVSYATMQNDEGGRLFYGLIIVGLVTMVKGFATVDNPY